MSEPNPDLEQLDLTERMPPFDRDDLGLAGEPAPSKPRATPPPIPAVARTSRPMRSATVPPPIPAAAKRRSASMPPPIPERALTQSGRVVAPVPPSEDESVDVDMNDATEAVAKEDAAPIDFAPSGSGPIAVTRNAAIMDAWTVPAEDVNDPWRVDEPVVKDPWRADDEPARTDEAPAESEALAIAPPLPTFMLSAVSMPTPLPASPRRGTLPPPVRRSTASLVVAPAPAVPSQVAFPIVVEPKLASREEDPTPLPRPVVDRDDEAWFDSPSKDDVDDELRWDSSASTNNFDDELRWDSTSALRKQMAAPIPIVKLGIAAVLVSGLTAMTVILLRGDHAKPAHHRRAAIVEQAAAVAPTPAPIATTPIATEPTPAPAPAIAPEPTPAPAVAAAPAAAAAPAVEAPASPEPISLTSEPAGATVTLVQDGVTSVVGRTPLVLSIDKAHSYDVVLTLGGYRTQLAHVDPNAAELRVALAADGAAPVAAAPVAAPAPAPVAASAPAPVAEVRVAAPAVPAPAATTRRVAMTKAEPQKRPAVAVAEPTPRQTRVATVPSRGNDGILMVSSKPPCEIAIDGVATVLMTPQRSIKLKPGKHKVTLFNLSRKIDKTFEVAILPGQPTKLIRDFMSEH